MSCLLINDISRINRKIILPVKILIFSVCFSSVFISYHSCCQKPSDKIDLYYANLPLLEHLIKTGIDSLRKQLNLPSLYNDSICYLAANDHGQYLMDLEEIQHFQNDSSKKTPQDRVEYYGAKGYQAGENIAKIYLHTPFSYHVGVEQPKTLSVSTYEEAAKFIVNAWVNSAEHYINILSKNYNITGIAAIINEDDKSLICVQVFAEADSNYHLKAWPSIFPYDNFIPEQDKLSASSIPKHTDCNDDRAWGITAPEDEEEIRLFNDLIGSFPNWYIIYNGNDVYLNMGEYESAVRLFENKYDGLALEIIPYSVYNCNSGSSSLSADNEIKDCIFRGVVTRPVYLDKLFRKNLDPPKIRDKEHKSFIPFAGRIPENITEPYEINVIFLKNNKLCKLIQSHHLCGEIPDHLVKIPLYINDELPGEGITYSPKFAIDTIDLGSLSYNSLAYPYNNPALDSDSLAVTEYLQLFSLLSIVEQSDEDTGRLMNLIGLRMDSIQNYLFSRFLDGKIDFRLIDALPALIRDDEGYFQRSQPLAQLYYNRIVFKYARLKDEFSDTEFRKINETMRNFRNPLPVAQYNYYAMLTNNMDDDVTGSITLANLREIFAIIQRINGSVSQSHIDSLVIFYHFQRILKYYIDGMFNYRRMYPSLEYIHNYYKKHYLSPEGRVKLARFFIQFRLYDFAFEVILPAAGFHPYNKEAFVLYLKLYYSGLITLGNETEYYENILKASDILPTEEWLGLFQGSCRINFQLLDYEPLRNLYCAKKISLELNEQ
jgi:hypothetical protein